MNNRTSFMTALILASVLAPGIGAQETAGTSWDFTVAPYVLFPHMDGSVSIRGIPIDVDVGPGDVFERLEFGAMLYLEAHSQHWAITLDGLYMNLGETAQLREDGRAAQVDMKQLAIEATGMRRVTPWAELGIGGRLNVIEGGLFIGPGDVILPGIDVSDSKTWFDPLLVARLRGSLAGLEVAARDPG